MSSIISRRRHPAAGYAAIVGGLVAVGVGYAALAGGGASAASPAQDTTQTSQGHSLFLASCSSCHGLDAQGTSVAPSLIGAGAAAVDFQMSTGRMPAKELGAENDRKPSDFTPTEIYDIASYISSLGGGPSIPASSQVSTSGANTALGQVLFSTNCAQCHGFAGAGGALTYGKNAPSLNAATPTQIYEAMLTGPEAMPVFNNTTLTPDSKRNIIAYVTEKRSEQNPGGFSLGRIGPVTEGLVAFLGLLFFMVLAAMWLTARQHGKTEN